MEIMFIYFDTYMIYFDTNVIYFNTTVFKKVTECYNGDNVGII